MAIAVMVLASVVILAIALVGVVGDVGRWIVVGVITIFWLVWTADAICGGRGFSREFRRGWRREA
jgi:hypothetical protein